MKIKRGFVTNSSSTSFIMIGKEIPESEVTHDNLKGRDIYFSSKRYFEAFYDLDNENIDEVLSDKDRYNFYEALLFKTGIEECGIETIELKGLTIGGDYKLIFGNMMS